MLINFSEVSRLLGFIFANVSNSCLSFRWGLLLFLYKVQNLVHLLTHSFVSLSKRSDLGSQPFLFIFDTRRKLFTNQVDFVLNIFVYSIEPFGEPSKAGSKAFHGSLLFTLSTRLAHNDDLLVRGTLVPEHEQLVLLDDVQKTLPVAQVPHVLHCAKGLTTYQSDEQIGDD